jgi:hypothetical protein
LLSSEHQILFPTQKNATEANEMSKTVNGMMADQAYIKWDSSDSKNWEKGRSAQNVFCTISWISSFWHAGKHCGGVQPPRLFI